MSEILMTHPDGSGRLIPHALWASLNAQYAARRAAFESSATARALETTEGRAAIRADLMSVNPVDRVEIAEPVGKYKGDLTEARVNARVDGEMNATMNKHGGAEFIVPPSSVYGTSHITPMAHPFFGANKE